MFYFQFLAERIVMKYIFAAGRYKWNTDVIEEDNNFVEG
jgi:hypothetical protein